MPFWGSTLTYNKQERKLLYWIDRYNLIQLPKIVPLPPKQNNPKWQQYNLNY